MRHGFKSEAERRAAAARTMLGLSPVAVLDAWTYAKHRGVRVFDFYALGLPALAARQLTTTDPDSWSAMTLQEGDAHVIVLNPSHAITRLRADLMHELAHIDLGHAPARVEVADSGLLLISDYSDDQEQEADWLGGALLLPRQALVRMHAQRRSVEQIASFFGVSTALCEWRLRMTGVDFQVGRTHRR